MTARKGGAVFILATAAVYYAVLAFFLAPAGCFWSGDAGVKFVQLESLRRQRFRTPALVYPGATFDTAGAGWPFPPPYGVARDGRYDSTFPPFFSLISIPFYAAFGLAGLRGLPFLGGMATLFAAWRLLRQFDLSPVAEVTGLALLAFGSPFAFYAATFWEHTLTTALATFALVLVGSVLLEGDSKSDGDLRPMRLLSSRLESRLLLAGVCCGLAFALRTEALVFALAVAAALVGVLTRHAHASVSMAPVQGSKKMGFLSLVCFFVGVALPVALVLGVNVAWYGHPLGLFESHFIENPSSRFEILSEMLVDAGGSLWSSNGLLLLFPIVLVGLLPLFGAFFASPLARFHAWVGTLFLVAMLLLAPNAGGKQFSPRYLLLAFPPLYVAAAAVLSRLLNERNRRFGVRRCAASAVLLLGVLSTARGLQGVERLWQEKNEIEAPMLREAARSPAEVIVSSHPYFPQQAASLYFDKTFLRVPVRADYVPDLSRADFLFEMARQGVESVLYVDDSRLPQLSSFPLVDAAGRGLRIEVGPSTVVGHYRFQLWRLKPPGAGV